MKHYYDRQCDGPVCNPKGLAMEGEVSVSDSVVNFISIRKGDTYARYKWSVFISPEGKNYCYCPRCTIEIMSRMGI